MPEMRFGFFLPQVPSLEAGTQGLYLPGLALLAAGRCTLQFDPFAISNTSRPPSDRHHLAFQLVPCSFPVPKILVPALLRLARRQESPEGSPQNADSNSVGLSGLRFCISHKLPEDAAGGGVLCTTS